ncbi:MAG: DNA repair protein RecN [Flavobacteriales bacterium]|nr:MAG: DNA repair protein RecN [Flavobacteriales bacterium]CAI8391765.1 MAG: DNA repair protein RecN [Flavobacteriales bacterium]
MLTKLKINNYALIDSLEITFNKGMTSITGETGAGKSIILGGLSMVLGSRVDNSKIINKEKKCFVEVTFDLSNIYLKDYFRINDLDYDELTIIRREVNQNGKSRAFINDTPVKLDQLSDLTNKLVDVHSQFNNLSILDSNFIFLILDSLSKNEQIVKEYSSNFKSLKSLEKELNDKILLRDKLNSDLDYNKFLHDEFNNLEINNINLEELQDKIKEADDLDQIKDVLSITIGHLNSEDVGVLDKLQDISRNLNRLSNSSERISLLCARIQTIIEELNIISSDTELILSDIDNNQENINNLRNIQDKIYSLQNKHRVNSIEDLLKIKNDIESKILTQNDIDNDIIKIEESIRSLMLNLKAIAVKIHNKRKSVIPDFEKLMNKNLIELGMEESEIKIDLSETEIIHKNGLSIGKLLLKSNKGSLYNELKDIASGGEISRIMLSVKSILSKYTKLASIIFDEIDTGISGSVSSKVGELMKFMAQNMQVIVITHTAQVASKGDFHFKVFKREHDDKVITDIKLLSDKERVNEIAEMLSGDKSNKSANELANELLN